MAGEPTPCTWYILIERQEAFRGSMTNTQLYTRYTTVLTWYLVRFTVHVNTCYSYVPASINSTTLVVLRLCYYLYHCYVLLLPLLLLLQVLQLFRRNFSNADLRRKRGAIINAAPQRKRGQISRNVYYDVNIDTLVSEEFCMYVVMDIEGKSSSTRRRHTKYQTNDFS